MDQIKSEKTNKTAIKNSVLDDWQNNIYRAIFLFEFKQFIIIFGSLFRLSKIQLKHYLT